MIKVGDKVKVRKGKSHDMDDSTQVGVVKKKSTPALAIKFEKKEKLHKWYTASELQKVSKKK